MNAEETRELERLREENARLRQIFNDGALLQYTHRIDGFASERIPEDDLMKMMRARTAHAIGNMLVKSDAVAYTERQPPDYTGGRAKMITGMVMVVPASMFHVFDLYLSDRNAPAPDADDYELEAYAIHLVNKTPELVRRLTETGQTYVRFALYPRLSDAPPPQGSEAEIAITAITCIVKQTEPGARPYARVIDQPGDRRHKRVDFKAERDALDYERELERRFGKKGPPIEPVFEENQKTPTIDTTGIEPAAILAALYNRARVQGMGALQRKPGDLSLEEARNIIADQGTAFDYLYGRVMKIDVAENPMRTALYDRDNGRGAARAALIEAGLIKDE